MFRDIFAAETAERSSDFPLQQIRGGENSLFACALLRSGVVIPRSVVHTDWFSQFLTTELSVMAIAEPRAL